MFRQREAPPEQWCKCFVVPVCALPACWQLCQRLWDTNLDKNMQSYTVTVVKTSRDDDVWDWRTIAVAVLMLIRWSTGFYLAEKLRVANRGTQQMTRSTQTEPPERSEMMTRTVGSLREQHRAIGLGSSGVKEEIAYRLVGFRRREVKAAGDIALLHQADY